MHLCAQTRGEFLSAPAGLKLNEIQVLGTHNSYQLPPDSRVIALVEPIISRLMAGMTGKMTADQLSRFHEEHPNPLSFGEALSYSHPDLKSQLNAGLRSLEIDINPDPGGGRFLNPEPIASCARKAFPASRCTIPPVWTSPA